jgi:hypothetical protein
MIEFIAVGAIAVAAAIAVIAKYFPKTTLGADAAKVEAAVKAEVALASPAVKAEVAKLIAEAKAEIATLVADAKAKL